MSGLINNLLAEHFSKNDYIKPTIQNLEQKKEEIENEIVELAETEEEIRAQKEKKELKEKEESEGILKRQAEWEAKSHEEKQKFLEEKYGKTRVRKMEEMRD